MSRRIPGASTRPLSFLTGTLLQPWTAVLVASHPTIFYYSSNSVSGLLAVGSQSGLSVYTLILENDLLTWSKKWATRFVPILNPPIISLTRR